MTKITKTVDIDGTIIYRNERGQYHNENAPAIIWRDNAKHWYKNGDLHNENGPACDYASGTKYWYLDGWHYSEPEWKNEMFKRCFKP